MTKRILLALSLVLWAVWPIQAQQSVRRDGRLSALGSVVLDVASMGQAGIDLRGTFSGTVSFEVATEDGQYVTVDCFTPAAPGTAVNSTTAAGVWSCPVAGMRFIRARMSSYTSGTAELVLSATAAGTSTVAAAGAGGTSDVNVTQIAGTAVAANSGTNSAGVIRTTLATDDEVNDNIAAMTSDIDTLVGSIGVDGSQGSTVPSGGPNIMGEAKDIDGSALPNVVTEGQSIRVATTLAGALLNTIVHEDGLSSPVVNEDVASAAADALIRIAAIRDDTLDARSGTEGDYEMLHLNASGALWAIDVNSAALLTAAQLLDDTVFVDDAAFTPATSKGLAIGAEVDSTATDSVDEGDFGALRMTADRRLFTATADPCSGAKTTIPIDIVTATTTELTAALSGASTYYYVCALNLVTAGANNVAIIADDTDNCGSATTGVFGGVTAAEGWNFAANGGIALGSGGSTVGQAQTANAVICVITSAAVQLSGSISVVAAP